MAFTRITRDVKNISTLPNVVSGQASTLKAKFDQAGVDIKTAVNGLMTELESAVAGNSIGVYSPNTTTAETLQNVVNYLHTLVSDCYTKLESQSLIGTATNNLVQDISINLNTGVFTITKKDGTVTTVDTSIEKIPASFDFVKTGNSYYLKVTNTDGTTSQVNVTELFNIYTFQNSTEVAFTTSTTDNTTTVSATIRDSSIGIDKLNLEAVSTLNTLTERAETAANSATTQAGLASGYKDSALASANSASTSADSASTYASNASTSATNASTSETNANSYASNASTSAATAGSKATLAQSWAVGGTGTRSGENTNNAKYWSEQAREAAGGSTVLVDNETIVKSASDIISAIAVKDNNSTATKTWRGSLEQYNAITSKDSNTIYYINDDYDMISLNNYRLIETITFNGSTSTIYRNTEPNGTAYNFKKMILVGKSVTDTDYITATGAIHINGSRLYASDRIYVLNTDTNGSTSNRPYMVVEIDTTSGLGKAYTRLKKDVTYNVTYLTINNFFANNITAVEFQSNGVTPVEGATLEIYAI